MSRRKPQSSLFKKKATTTTTTPPKKKPTSRQKPIINSDVVRSKTTKSKSGHTKNTVDQKDNKKKKTKFNKNDDDRQDATKKKEKKTSKAEEKKISSKEAREIVSMYNVEISVKTLHEIKQQEPKQHKKLVNVIKDGFITKYSEKTPVGRIFRHAYKDKEVDDYYPDRMKTGGLFTAVSELDHVVCVEDKDLTEKNFSVTQFMTHLEEDEIEQVSHTIKQKSKSVKDQPHDAQLLYGLVKTTLLPTKKTDYADSVRNAIFLVHEEKKAFWLVSDEAREKLGPVVVTSNKKITKGNVDNERAKLLARRNEFIRLYKHYYDGVSSKEEDQDDEEEEEDQEDQEDQDDEEEEEEDQEKKRNKRKAPKPEIRPVETKKKYKHDSTIASSPVEKPLKKSRSRSNASAAIAVAPVVVTQSVSTEEKEEEEEDRQVARLPKTPLKIKLMPKEAIESIPITSSLTEIQSLLRQLKANYQELAISDDLYKEKCDKLCFTDK